MLILRKEQFSIKYPHLDDQVDSKDYIKPQDSLITSQEIQISSPLELQG